MQIIDVFYPKWFEIEQNLMYVRRATLNAKILCSSLAPITIIHTRTETKN